MNTQIFLQLISKKVVFKNKPHYVKQNIMLTVDDNTITLAPGSYMFTSHGRASCLMVKDKSKTFKLEELLCQANEK